MGDHAHCDYANLKSALAYKIGALLKESGLSCGIDSPLLDRVNLCGNFHAHVPLMERS